MVIAPRPPILSRLSPARRNALEVSAGAGYGLFAWAVLIKPAGPASAAITALLLAAAVALVWRRPPAALAAALAVYLAGPISPAAGTSGFLGLMPMAGCVFAAAATRGWRTALAGLAAGVSAALATALPPSGGRGGVVPFAAAFLATWVAGRLVGRQRQYAHELQWYSARLAEAEVEQARRALVEQRLHLAREIHDVVAHSLSVVTVQATFGNLVIERSPAEAAAALSAIERTGREALTELRQLVGVLRTDSVVTHPVAGAPDCGAPLLPTPGVADLERLVGGSAAAGLQVRLEVTGDPVAVPPGVGLCVYRIVQEALTNALRHSGAGPVVVTLAYRGGELTVEVTDAGTAGDVGANGHGLTGMRERVAGYGGWITAGAVPGGGFRVAATLPLPDAVESR